MIGPADDIHAIASLKARYCAAVDSAAQDVEAARVALLTLFAEDVVADYGQGLLAGAEAVAGFLCPAIAESSAWALHTIHTPLIVVDADTATGDWTVTTHVMRRAGGAVDVIVGRYADTFRRTAAGWRMAGVRFTAMR